MAKLVRALRPLSPNLSFRAPNVKEALWIVLEKAPWRASLDSEEKWIKNYTKLLCANLQCVRQAEQKKPPASWVKQLMNEVAPVETFVAQHLPDAPAGQRAATAAEGEFDIDPQTTSSRKWTIS